MARPLRVEYRNAVYHVTARGMERRRIFRDEHDFERMTGILEENAGRHGIKLYGYALMRNHYHLLIETPNANLSAFMHDVQTHYTSYFNNRHGRVGHLFQGRYKALVVEKDAYLLELSRYIHLNPVRAGIVEHPGQWKWSSYAAVIGRKSADWIDGDEILRYFGRGRSQAVSKYKAFVARGMTAPAPDIMNKVQAQLILGSDDFAEKIKKSIGSGKTVSEGKDIISSRKLLKWSKKEAGEAISTVAAYYGVTVEEIKAKGRRSNLPREVAMSVFRKFSRWPLSKIGTVFGADYSAVNKAVKRLSEKAAADRKISKELNEVYSKFPA